MQRIWQMLLSKVTCIAGMQWIGSLGIEPMTVAFLETCSTVCTQRLRLHSTFGQILSKTTCIALKVWTWSVHAFPGNQTCDWYCSTVWTIGCSLHSKIKLHNAIGQIYDLGVSRDTVCSTVCIQRLHLHVLHLADAFIQSHLHCIGSVHLISLSILTISRLSPINLYLRDYIYR